MLKKVSIIILISLLIAGCLPKPGPRIGDFNAVVLDLLTNEPVAGVEILIGETEDETGIKGQFSLAGLPPGEYQVRMSREWYESKTVTYKHLGKPAPVKFYLTPASNFSGRIYYSYDEGQNKEIYELVLTNRTINKVLSLPDSAETNPAWSKSGKLALESTSDGSRILLYNLSGKKFESILGQDSLPGEHPSLDKGGKNMVCKTRYNSALKIVRYNLQDRSQFKVYDQSGYNPVISPCGAMVAYVSGNYTKLYIYIKNSGFYEFLPGNGYKLNNPCWSPDGTKIAFEVYQDSNGQRAIYYIKVDPIKRRVSGMQQLTFPLGAKEQHKHPTWGEDDMIYFSGNIIYSSRNDIYAVKFDDTPNLMSNPWIMVSKGPGNKLYPCWGK